MTRKVASNHWSFSLSFPESSDPDSCSFTFGISLDVSDTGPRSKSSSRPFFGDLSLFPVSGLLDGEKESLFFSFRSLRSLLILCSHATTRNYQYPPVIPVFAMDNLNKTDLSLRLRAYGEEPSEAWTKLDLIRHLWRRPRRASRKKADLIKYVAKTMVKIMEQTVPVGADLMGFGKFAARPDRDGLPEEVHLLRRRRPTRYRLHGRDRRGRDPARARRARRWLPWPVLYKAQRREAEEARSQ
eukprot:s5329_g5.t1